MEMEVTANDVCLGQMKLSLKCPNKYSWSYCTNMLSSVPFVSNLKLLPIVIIPVSLNHCSPKVTI
jgi:hypothetical protein